MCAAFFLLLLLVTPCVASRALQPRAEGTILALFLAFLHVAHVLESVMASLFKSVIVRDLRFVFGGDL